MKSFIITGLSTLVLGSFLTPVNATEVVAVNSNIEETRMSYVSPVNLVNHARGGSFTEQVIPSHIGLSLAVKSNKIDAETLVESAISAGRLSSSTLDNSRYLSAVEFELSRLDND